MSEQGAGVTEREGFRTVLLAAIIATSLLFAPKDPEPRNSVGLMILALASTVGLMILGARSRDRFSFSFGVCSLPTALGSVARVFVEPDPAWTPATRGIGLVMMVCLTTALALDYTRKVKELDRVLLTESTSVAFFVTLAGMGAYAVAERWFDAPKVPLAVVPVFALGLWGAIVLLMRRRFS